MGILSNVLEDHFPPIRRDGHRSNKSITLGGSANLDMSGSTGVIKGPSGGISGLVSANVNFTTGSSNVLTAAQSGSLVTLNPSGATTITLPAPAVGLKYSFIFATAATGSNTVKVITATPASQFMQGYLDLAVSAGTAKFFFGDGSTTVSLNFNGGTTGGLLGGDFTLTALSSTIWQVSGTTEGSGTVATPFGTS